MKENKPKDKFFLTGQKLYELRWFCENVTGVKGDMYPIMDKVNSFNDRIARLEKTCDVIDKLIKEYQSQSADNKEQVERTGWENKNDSN